MSWKIPIDYKFVDFAKKMLRNYPIQRQSNYNRNREKIDRAIYDLETETYILKNMCLRFYKNEKNDDQGYAFYYDDLILDLHYSSYRVNLFITISQIIEHESEKFDIPGVIAINKIGYEKYKKSLERILESHGKHLFGLLCAENCPFLLNSAYKEFVDVVRIRESMKKT